MIRHAIVLGITAALAFAQSAKSFGMQIQGTDLFTGRDVWVNTDGKKGMVVVFLSALCPCSNSHISELSNLSREYPEFSFVAVHANANESAEISYPYFKKAALPFSVIQDQESKLADQFQALKTPHTFVLDPSGEKRFEGGMSSSQDFQRAEKKYLRQALSQIRAGKAVDIPNARTLGCVIQRSKK